MSLKDVYFALEEIAAEPSTNTKQILIQKHLDLPYFKEVVYFTYNPFLKYKITDVPYTAYNPTAFSEPIFAFLKKLSLQKGANNQDRITLSNLSSIDPETCMVVNMILKSDLRCGAGTTLFRKFIPEIPKHETMLCGKDFDKFMKLAGSYDNVVGSIKQDGVRTWAVVDKLRQNVKYLSRNGKEFINFDVFDEVFIEFAKKVYGNQGDYVILDGEVVTKDKNFQKVLTQFSRHTGAQKELFEFRIFDIVNDLPFYARYKLLTEHFVLDTNLDHPSVCLVHHFRNFKSKKEIYDLLDKVAGEGEEGLVIKTFNGPYEMKRSNHWCKLKLTYTEDLPVLRFEYGTGKYKNLLGALICDRNGVEVRVGSGYDDQERADLLNIPEMIEVKFKNVTDDGSLREPIFVRIREDK
jgi:DNA ligase 1